MLVAAVLVLPATGQAQQLFDFDGQANVPANVGETLSMVAVVLDGAPAISTPLPLDFANFEYTLVIDGLVLDSVAGNDQFYSGGTISLYEDASTAASFGDDASFADGTALLVGTFNVLSRSPLLSLATISGSVDWTWRCCSAREHRRTPSMTPGSERLWSTSTAQGRTR